MLRKWRAAFRLSQPYVVLLLCGAAALFMASAWGRRADNCALATVQCPPIAGLLAEREGYGGATTGGLGGQMMVVTSNADSGPGTLRDLLRRDRRQPLWITFAGAMEIDLLSTLWVPPNTTIDGRGHSITLRDFGLAVSDTHNVIISHVAVDGRFKQDTQAVNVVTAHDVWLNHLTLARMLDRLINVKVGSTDVTLSWIRFEDHNRVMLFNNLADNLFEYYDRDSILRVTLHHSYFVNTVQRNPRAQLGTSHIYNNLLENWYFYGMSFSLEHRSLIEGNIFSNASNRPCDLPGGIGKEYCNDMGTAPGRAMLPNGYADEKWYNESKDKYQYTHDFRAFLKLKDNLYLGDAKSDLSDYRPEQVPILPYCYSYEQPDAALAQRIREGAGNLGRPSQMAPRTCPKDAKP